jgi:putative ABC transport system permease protein
VGLYVHDELSYDRFHENVDRIARLEVGFQQGDHYFAVPPTPPILDEVVQTADVETAVRIFQETRLLVRRGDVAAYQEHVLFAPPEFLAVFTFPLQRGDPESALSRPRTVLLTEEAAATFFGDEDPIGHTIELGDDGEFEVTGVFRPAPANSTLRFSLVATSLEREERPSPQMVYGLLRDGSAHEAVHASLLAAAERHMPPGMISTVAVEPLASLHLRALSPTRNRDLAGNVRYMYLFGGVGLLILLLAAVNFVNLATAHALGRAREVGVRKTLGAGRYELVRRFLTEAALQSAAALAITIGLIVALLPAFNSLVGKGITLSMVPALVLVGGAGALWAVTTLLAGAYPAFVLSAFEPVRVLKGGPAREARGNGWLRRGLVVFQFSVTIAMLIGLFTIVRQMDHLRSQHMALAADQVLLLEPRADALGNYAAFKDALLTLPGVHLVAAGHFPGGLGMPVILDGEEEQRPVNHLHVDGDFFEALGLRLVSGRVLDEDHSADVLDAVLLNQAATNHLGFGDAAVGQRLRRMTTDFQLVESTVVGVVEDFAFRSLKTAIGPQVIALLGDPAAGAARSLNPPAVIVRLEPTAIASSLAGISSVWSHFAPDHPFEYTFLDERFAAFYVAETRLQRLFMVFAGLALLLACLGLVALAAYTAERRTKEIGVRKVLGATAASIVALLSRDFLLLVALAFVLGAPAAHWFMSRWLEDYAYRIELGPGLFAAAGLLAAGVALLAVGYHAYRAASGDPVAALRSE